MRFLGLEEGGGEGGWVVGDGEAGVESAVGKGRMCKERSVSR